MYRLKAGMNAESKLAPDPLPNPINTPHPPSPPDPPVPFSSVPLLRLVSVWVCASVGVIPIVIQGMNYYICF